MELKSDMDQKQFDLLVSKIDSKHITIGIKDKDLAQRLAKLYNDIYCDTNNGAYIFGMYKGLLNCNQKNTDEEFEYFNCGMISFKQFLIHSVFVNTLCCLRRITDKDDNTQSITRLKKKVVCEIRGQSSNNKEVVEWCDTLEQKYKIIRNSMQPILTYIDKRISHFERNWEFKIQTSKIRDIGNIYNLIDRYNNIFRMFYELNYSPSTIFISNGENDAARFIRSYYTCERLDDLKTAILKQLYIDESRLEQSRQIDDLKTAILKQL